MTQPLDRIGRYEIVGELGQGMTGVVYDAFDPVLQRPVALKVIRHTYALTREDEERFERRFVREARLAARLSHPGIIVVHEAGREDEGGRLYIAMERLEGKTAAEVLADHGRLPWREALRVVARAAEALDHAHKQGIIHRDVKPANIMLLPTGEVKVMDFGLAVGEHAPDRTATGQAVGTPAFMSPEQVMGEPLDARSDLFSLGAVAYALISGQRPFSSDRVGDTLKRVVRHVPPPASESAADVPAAVDQLLARALAKAPGDRFQSGLEFSSGINEILRGSEPAVTRARRRDATPPEQGEESLIDLPLGDEPLAAADTGDPFLTASARGVRPRSAGPLRWLPVAMLAGGLLFLALAWARPQPFARLLGSIPGIGPQPAPSAPASARPGSR